MFANQRVHKGEKGQNALETIIVLIVFVVVAAIFAFTVLSAGSSSAEKSIQARLESIQSTMHIKGSVVAKGTSLTVNAAIFTLSLVAGGSPINLSSIANGVVISYKDATQSKNDVDWSLKWIASKQAAPNDLLEAGELAEITVDLRGLATPLGANTAFNLVIKPPKGAVLNINRTTPAAIQSVMDLN